MPSPVTVLRHVVPWLIRSAPALPAHRAPAVVGRPLPTCALPLCSPAVRKMDLSTSPGASPSSSSLTVTAAPTVTTGSRTVHPAREGDAAEGEGCVPPDRHGGDARDAMDEKKVRAGTEIPS